MLDQSSFSAEERALSIAVARTILVQAIEDGIGIDAAIVERAAEAVHLAWQERHHHPDNPIDIKPYADLPEDEKEKDREFVRLAQTEMGQASL